MSHRTGEESGLPAGSPRLHDREAIVRQLLKEPRDPNPSSWWTIRPGQPSRRWLAADLTERLFVAVSAVGLLWALRTGGFYIEINRYSFFVVCGALTALLIAALKITDIVVASLLPPHRWKFRAVSYTAAVVLLCAPWWVWWYTDTGRYEHASLCSVRDDGRDGDCYDIPIQRDTFDFSASRLLVALGITALPILMGWVRVRREARLGGPSIVPLVLDHRSVANNGTPLMIVHVSDLHMTGDDNGAVVEGRPSGNCAIKRAVHALSCVIGRAHLVLFTGDVVDSGAPREWGQFFSLLTQFDLTNAVYTPGNHELNIIDRRHWIAEGATGFLRACRIIRVIYAIDAIQGTRARVETASDGWVSVREVVDRHRQHFDRFLDDPPAHHRSAQAYSRPLHTLSELFPMIVELPEYRLAVIVLNSNRLAGNIVTNAFGMLGRTQVLRLRSAVSRYQGWRQIVMLHHHVALPPVMESWRDALFARAMVVIDDSRLLRTLCDGTQRVVFHGHRHFEFVGQLGPALAVVSAPSAGLSTSVRRAAPAICGYGLRLEDDAVVVDSKWRYEVT